ARGALGDTHGCRGDPGRARAQALPDRSGRRLPGRLPFRARERPRPTAGGRLRRTGERGADRGRLRSRRARPRSGRPVMRCARALATAALLAGSAGCIISFSQTATPVEHTVPVPDKYKADATPDLVDAAGIEGCKNAPSLDANLYY